MSTTENSFFKNKYSFSITGTSSAYADEFDAITSNAVAVVEYLSDYVSWEGTLDFVTYFDGPQTYGPNGTWFYSSGNGLLPAYGGNTFNGGTWRTWANSEAFTGIDANGADFDIGAWILPNLNGNLTNHGDPLYFDQNPDPYTTPDVPAGTHDFFTVFLHEVLHSLGIWSLAQNAGSPNTAFDDLTIERNGQYYFEGPAVMSLLGQALPLAISGSRDHYGLNTNGSNPVERGTVFEYGNYEENRWHLGKLELAILSDLGYTTANTQFLPLVETADENYTGVRIMPIEGTIGDDIINGSSATETIIGGAGNDTIFADGGSDTIQGGGGLDTIKYSLAQANYTLAVGKTNSTVKEISSSTNDSFSTIERIVFADNAIALDIDGANSAGGIYRTYKAAFNRTPEATGFGYWIDRADNGASAVQMAEEFVWSAEFQTLYGVTTSDNYLVGNDIEAVVDLFYRNVLGRAPDQGGLDYYASTIVAQDKTGGQVLAEIADSAENRTNLLPTIENGMSYDLWVA